MALTLRRIRFENFATVKKADLDLVRRGLVLVTGSNLAAADATSVGAGKTLLGEGLSRALFGIRGRYGKSNINAYSADDTKPTLVEVEADLAGKPLIVWYSCRHPKFSKTGEALRFEFDGNQIELGRVTETRAELNRVLGITSELAGHTLFVDGQRLHFEELDEKTLVDLFLESLAHADWESAAKRAGDLFSRLDRVRADDEAVKTAAKRRLDSLIPGLSQAETAVSRAKETYLRALQSYEKQKTQLEINSTSARERVTTLESRLDLTRRQLKKLEDEDREARASLELEVSRLTSAVLTSHRPLQTAKSLLARYQAERRAAQADYDRLIAAPTTCPTCRQPLDQEARQELADHQASARLKLEEILVITAGSEKDVIAAEQANKSAETALAAAKNALKSKTATTETVSLSQRYETDERDLSRARLTETEAQSALSKLSLPSDHDVISAESRRDQLSQDISQVKTEICDLDSKINELSATLKVVTYWRQAFNPTGIPNLILDHHLPSLNTLSGDLSRQLTGDLITLTIKTRRELASAETRANLVLCSQARHGSVDFAGNSKGEGGVTNLLVSELLYTAGQLWSTCGYRWLDEAVNSQDETVRHRVYSYFRKQAQTHDLLTFVVDHAADVVRHADHILVAEKSALGETTYHWS